MKDFRELIVWQKAHQLTLDTYHSTARFPRHERYGLIDQLRRSASSIPSNIAEGCGRSGDAELRRYLQIAMGSASELEYQLLLAKDLSYLPREEYDPLDTLVTEIQKMLAAFIKRLRG